MALSAGTRLGPYEILAPLGAGGMGEVYRARDPRLRREVALKVLPAELASEPERLERFQREAETLAALSHPHIVTIHSVEEVDGLHFLTMELVEGRPLSKIIPRGGLPLPRFFRIAIPLTEAVSAAHEKGITHRDLKPGNVMVTDEDRVKVLDFGLAKPRQEAEALEDSELPTAAVTVAGRVVGTAPYMSPEQVQGKPVDHRSDVFSLGIMLYEMVTGDRPFQGDTSAELASSILRDTPVSVTERKADLPRDLGKLVRHCLEKEPTRRFQSILDLRNELEELRREVETGEALVSTGAPIIARRVGGKRRAWLVGGALAAALAAAIGYLLTRSPPEPPAPETASAERKMLVVLPFENLGAPEDAYFAAGMTEEITNRLARVSGLGVISRTSAVQYDRTGKTVKQIGSDLGADFVLEGSVRWEHVTEGPGQVRISPQLVRVADDTNVWARSYDRELDSIFAVQSEIAGTVVRQIGVALLPDERRALAETPTDSLDAHRAYLKGLEHYRAPDMERETLELASQMFQLALEYDPDFVAALSHLSQVHLLIHHAVEPDPEALEKALEAAQRIFELDPASPLGHRALGYYHYWGHKDYERARKEFAIAERRLPNDVELIAGIGLVDRRQGRFDEAVAAFKRVLELDPQNVSLTWELGATLAHLRRYAEAERYYERSISLAPDQVTAYVQKAVTVVSWHGSLERARATLERMPRKEHSWYHESSGWLETLARNFPAAQGHLARGSEERFKETWPEIPFLLEGDLYRFMNQPEQARAAYEAALAALEDWAREKPEHPVPHERLALAYAGLGRKSEALREARQAVKLLPISRDALEGDRPLWTLALVCTMVGEHERAIDEIAHVLSIPSRYSAWYLRLDPRFDPLRDHPRFKKLVGEDWQAEPPHSSPPGRGHSVDTPEGRVRGTSVRQRTYDERQARAYALENNGGFGPAATTTGRRQATPASGRV